MENPSQPGTNRPVWDAEATHPEACNKLRDALREIIDPEIGLNVIQLGLIRNVRIEPDQVMIRMILTTPFCPYGPALIEMTRQKAEEALGLPTFIELGMEMWDFSMMEEGIDLGWGLY
ncbi:MAG: metal-sulfur cluster assembly factor [Thermanaerothrix sp.]|jgi:metal-sulfur cluster biosynthetic enzyme|uniref:Iron-sulfur cluster assembly protein n=1 Tax=Thermanaerothrix solaris TaxID=3058434 RepID=A0ABU3NJ36_9CHLR|nr:MULTISPECIES: iron-sulfur cluster assembly protein [unclassified Thermanaerothrix]MDT8896817.1 iron-sulfur cluster assembly protein [Thermanaerothrix sp. 4228-RoL]